jgi:hypothetical protein
MKPGSLTAFQVLGWLTVGLNMLAIIIIAIFFAEYGAPLTAYLLAVLLPLLIVGLLAGLIVGVVKRSPVARILYAVVAGLLILLVIIHLLTTRVPALGVILTILQIGLLLGSIVCVFLPGVGRWIAYGNGGGFSQGSGFAPSQGNWNQPSGGQWNQPTQPWSGPAGSGGHDTTVAAATRPCPHCAEPIRVEASKCRFCGSAVQPLV